ncbi:MAG: hypothetical protein MJ157_05655 [Clostridia bacterium]|nr:hypothetical protein [Clostridia bacterium]
MSKARPRVVIMLEADGEIAKGLEAFNRSAYARLIVQEALEREQFSEKMPEIPPHLVKHAYARAEFEHDN